MTKNSHLFSSIFTITVIVLPILFILGYALSILLSPLLTNYFDGFSIFFTIIGLFSISPFVIPPPSKKLRNFSIKLLISFWKKFLKLKSTGQVKFDNTIVHFATVRQSTTQISLDDETIYNDNEITDVTYFTSNEQMVKGKSSHPSTKIPNYKKIWSLFPKIFFSLFNKICSISLKNSIFVLIFNSFFVRTAFIKSGREINGFGGVPFEFRNGTQNQLQYKTKKSIKEVCIWVK